MQHIILETQLTTVDIEEALAEFRTFWLKILKGFVIFERISLIIDLILKKRYHLRKYINF